MPTLATPVVIAALAAIILFGASALLGSCSARGQAGGPGKKIAVASIFPAYDFTRAIAGERMTVSMLLPPGVEPHDFDPKPADMASLSKADLFVYMGDRMEPWAAGLVSGAGNKRLVVAQAGVADAETGGDPHIWLDPVLASRLADAIEAGLAKADPAGAATYKTNADALRARLADLDAKIAAALARATRKTVVFGGHNTFGLFARRYGLDFISPYDNFTHDTEPTAQAMTTLLATMQRTGSGTIFYGELLEPRVAEVLARESGARLELLHGLHNVDKAELDSGVDYFKIMEENLSKLEKALGVGG